MFARILLACLVGGFLCSCETTSSDPRVAARQAKIRLEPRGDHYIGRRYWVKGSRTWGWLRRPGEPWDRARLVIMNERYMKNPDRLPEYGRSGGGLTNGYDHNVEYRIRGYFSGEKAYDPTTNLIVPEFFLQGYEVLDRSPGWLFSPSDSMDNRRLPRTHVMILAEVVSS